MSVRMVLGQGLPPCQAHLLTSRNESDPYSEAGDHLLLGYLGKVTPAWSGVGVEGCQMPIPCTDPHSHNS